MSENMIEDAGVEISDSDAPKETVTVKAILAMRDSFRDLATEELRVDSDRAEELSESGRYQFLTADGIERIRVPIGDDGETALADLDQNIHWHEATYVVVLEGWTRRYFRLIDEGDGWPTPWEATDLVRQESAERMKFKRMDDLRSMALRSEQISLDAKREELRSEPGRMQPPVHRESRVRRERRADGNMSEIMDEKLPLQVKYTTEGNEIRDEDGWIIPSRTRSSDVLLMLQANGTLTADQAKAGRRFHAAFVTAQMDPLRGTDYSREGGGSPVEMSDRVLDAKGVVDQAMLALGGYRAPMGLAVWFVAGCSLSLKEFAQRERFAAGRSLSIETATTLLVDGLDSLAKRHEDIEQGLPPLERPREVQVRKLFRVSRAITGGLLR